MADKLKFSLVSPEAELFSGEVDQVDVPGTEGDFGVFAQHAPFMAAIRTGAITVFNDGTETKYMIEGGFADVTPDGLTILAEKCKQLDDITAEMLDEDIKKAEAHLANTEGDARLDIAQHLDGLRQLAGSI
ncbi:MAG TPA: F0F1 ATP synthase subunit epsilon [Hellea balneolensis]|uniref:ATP synthase epsilon chain n=1 Tax=Hellea balneolensis TaxID=287478 RepID=A0A7C5R1A7_9PROT|nr:F0F1 ATP synthase subunit epsilon [Hellea balneolensis]